MKSFKFQDFFSTHSSSEKAFAIQIEPNTVFLKKGDMSTRFKILEEDEYLKILSKGTCEDLNQLKDYVVAIQIAGLISRKKKVLVDEANLQYKLSTPVG